MIEAMATYRSLLVISFKFRIPARFLRSLSHNLDESRVRMPPRCLLVIEIKLQRVNKLYYFSTHDTLKQLKQGRTKRRGGEINSETCVGDPILIKKEMGNGKKGTGHNKCRKGSVS